MEDSRRDASFGLSNKYRMRVKTIGNKMLSRINLKKIRDVTSRLSLDISEDGKSKTVLLSLPSSMFPENEYSKRLSTKARLDSASEVMSEIETVDYSNSVVGSSMF